VRQVVSLPDSRGELVANRISAKGQNGAFALYSSKRKRHWDASAEVQRAFPTLSKYYHARLAAIYRNLIPEGAKVLELGCGCGDLLASLKPSYGVGIDFSPKILDKARAKYPGLTFIEADVHEFALDGPFDFIILSDLVNDLWDVQTVFGRIGLVSSPGTRIIINFYSHLWELPLRAAQHLGAATRTMPQNWLTVEDLTHLIFLADLEAIRHFAEFLWPFPTIGLATLFNRYLVKLWPFRYFALTNFIVARPAPAELPAPEPSVSVIVPARNEAGNIRGILERTPEMGSRTELIFVEGNSGDGTYEVIEKLLPEYPGCNGRLFRQTGRGKGDAVRLGFSEATGDILMILDADMTVFPEDLPRFCEAIASGKGEFINGVRLVYPMEKQAMRFLNLAGNKFFSLAFSWLLGQSIKDTLCGTKVLWRKDYFRIANNRAYFGEFDPFGDFDLLFGAAKLNLKIVELPVRYGERTYGTTNIRRFSHGFMLLKMVAFAARKIKFT